MKKQYAVHADGDSGRLRKGKIICIYGTVCSGKSCYAKRLAKERHAVVFSLDEMLVPLYGIYPERLEKHTAVARTYLLGKALEVMEAGTPIILDWGFWTRNDRRETSDYFAQSGYAVEWHGMDISGDVLRRNAENRYAELQAGRRDVYPADENLLAKAEEIIEPPAKDEMDVWIKVE